MDSIKTTVKLEADKMAGEKNHEKVYHYTLNALRIKIDPQGFSVETGS